MTFSNGVKKLGPVFLIILATVLMRLVPLLQAPLAAYGYDYGLYLYAFKNLEGFRVSALLDAIQGTYQSLLFFLLKPLHLGPEAALNSVQFLSSLLLPAAFYFYLRKTSKLAAFFAGLLAAVSIIQSETFTMFLLKTALALPLLILVFKFLEEKKYALTAIVSFLIFVTHRTTFLVLGITLFLYFCYIELKNPRPRRLGLLLIGLVLTAQLAGAKLIHFVEKIFAYPNPNRIIGIFLENQSAVAILWPVAILAGAGLIISLTAKKHQLFAIFTGVCVFWIILKMPFYRRMFIYLDLGLICYAAYFLGTLDYKSRLSKVILVLFFAAMGLNLTTYFANLEPLMSRGEIEEVKDFEKTGTILAISSDDAPWILGFLPSAAATVFAPGMFADPHTYEDWVAFWAGRDQNQFLQSYDPPLYLYSRSLPGFAETVPCLRRLTENFYLYACQ